MTTLDSGTPVVGGASPAAADVPVPAATVLGRAAARIRYPDLPDVVRERLLAVVADTLAVVVASAGRPEIAAVRAALARGDGPSTVIGRRGGADPGTAALLNAMPVAAEQSQDGHRAARGHPGSHVVPAVLAAAEARAVPGNSGHGIADSSGPAVLAAMLAGYEVGVRVGVAMGGTPAGVHDAATWGTIGAAAGVAHLYSGGDAAAVAAAIDLAASLPVLPDWDTVSLGATGQHVFLGAGAHLGVVCGTAAATGLRPVPGTLERHFAARSAARFDRAMITDSVDAAGRFREYEIRSGYLKRHPTCAHLHGVNDAVAAILAGAAPPPDDIESVTVDTYGVAAGFAEAAPANDLAARFSIPYTVAVALYTGCLDRDSFGTHRLADQAIRALAARVRVRHDPDLDAGYPAGRPAVVTVRLASGRTLRARTDLPRGDGDTALDDADVRAKPGRLLAACLGDRGAGAVLDAVARLADDGLAPLTAALRAAGG